jgi:hypothetical protein
MDFYEAQSDAGLLSCLFAGIDNDNDGVVEATWEILEGRGWSDTRINSAIDLRDMPR